MTRPTPSPNTMTASLVRLMKRRLINEKIDLEMEPELLRAIVRYEPETGRFVWLERIARTVTVGAEAGAGSDSKWYRGIQIFGKRFLSHRLAVVWMTGEKPELVDHINGDRTDNRWSNLRCADNRRNQFNSKRSSQNTTGHKNVGYSDSEPSRRKKYRVFFRVNGRVKTFGRFAEFQDAVQCAERVRAMLHGEFGRSA